MRGLFFFSPTTPVNINFSAISYWGQVFQLFVSVEQTLFFSCWIILIKIIRLNVVKNKLPNFNGLTEWNFMPYAKSDVKGAFLPHLNITMWNMLPLESQVWEWRTSFPPTSYLASMLSCSPPKAARKAGKWSFSGAQEEKGLWSICNIVSVPCSDVESWSGV